MATYFAMAYLHEGQIKFTWHFDGNREKTTANRIDVNEAKMKIKMEERRKTTKDIEWLREKMEHKKQQIILI